MVRYTLYRTDCPQCGRMLRRGVPRFGPRQLVCKHCGAVTQTGFSSWNSFTTGQKIWLAILEIIFPSWIGFKGCQAFIFVPMIQAFFWTLSAAPLIAIGSLFQKTALGVMVFMMFLGMAVYPILLVIRLTRLIRESKQDADTTPAQA